MICIIKAVLQDPYADRFQRSWPMEAIRQYRFYYTVFQSGNFHMLSSAPLEHTLRSWDQPPRST